MFTVQDIARRQSKQPKFIIEGTTRSDIHQGEIGKMIVSLILIQLNIIYSLRYDTIR